MWGGPERRRWEQAVAGDVSALPVMGFLDPDGGCDL